MVTRFIVGILTVFAFLKISYSQCQPVPGTDSVEAKMDPEGYLSLYNGEDLTGWWINCKSHGTTGGDWWIEDGILYSDQKSGGDGGLLYTNKKYRNLDIIVEVWPGWGNDGGMFFRANGNGPAYQIVIDYKAAKTVGGVWGENIYNINHKPYFFENSPTDIKTGNVTNPVGGPWTDERWNNIWDADGFNFLRGVVVGRPPNMKAYINGEHITDFNAPQIASQLGDDGYFGLQIHGGTENWGQDPNKYRSVRARELDDNGQPLRFPDAPVILTQPQPVTASLGEAVQFSVSAEFGDMLNYQWQKDGVDIPGAIEAAYNIASVAQNDAGSYTVVLSNKIGTNTTTSEAVQLSTPGTGVKYLKGVSPNQIKVKWNQSNSLNLMGYMETDYQIKLMDVNGKIMYENKGPAGDINLEIINPESGMTYLLITAAGNTSVRKILSISSF